MRSNGSSGAQIEAAQTTNDLSYVTWQTDETIALPIGVVQASGDASPQVRNPQRLAEIGDIDRQIAHIRRMIVEALASALVGMEPTVDDLDARRDEIASLALVASNMRLGAVGVALLDLRITTLQPLIA